MAKGARRTKEVFEAGRNQIGSSSGDSSSSSSNNNGNNGSNNNNNGINTNAGTDLDNEDEELKAALAKAKRLKRLKEMSSRSSNDSSNDNSNISSKLSAASAQTIPNAASCRAAAGDVGAVVFETDTTQEFATRLMSRKAQQEQEEEEEEEYRAIGVGPVEPKPKPKRRKRGSSVGSCMQVDVENEGESLSELVNDFENAIEKEEGQNSDSDDDDDDWGGASGMASNNRRGMAGVLGMLKTTGELSKGQGGKEELRGRSKDVKTYDDYKELDLKSVVRIDSKTATDKDKMIANKQINLEYRDDHGRLLTRKEAFRQMSYQFHGHGSGKKKEEKRLEAIRNEEKEKKAARDGNKGTMGALKKTQEITGKAFVVHRT
mgnify:CR=1 FL=1